MSEISNLEYDFEFKKVPRFTVNLNETAEIRWNEIIATYFFRLKKVLSLIDEIISNTFTRTILRLLVTYYANNVFYIEELRAISKRANIPVDKLIIMQLCYEMFAACTSIIINEDTETVHYRTMDWEMRDLADLTIMIDFVKDDEKLFTATSWAGYVGVMTGVKQNVCSIALNYRRTNDRIIENFRQSVSGAWPIGFLIRHLLETETSYDRIESCLKNSRVISPCYVTISGPKLGQGSIISRTRSGTDKYKKLSMINHDYLVQTNIDYDRSTDPTVPNIVHSIERIQKVNEIMKKYKGINNSKDLIQIFNEWPIINETTIYITTMRASTGSIHSYF